jgi:hypothetical protein
MEVAMQQAWMEIVVAAVRDVGHRLATIAPRLLAAVTLVAIAWVAGALARRGLSRVLRAIDLDRRWAGWGLPRLPGGGARQRPSELAGRFVFWALLFVGVLMALEALEMPGTAGAVPVALGLLSHLVVAALVLVGGWILAQFLAQAALIGAVNAQIDGASLLAAVVRWLVLAVAFAIALTQLGIAREMVLLVFGIAFGGAVLALALAFGLGARDLARQALEGYLQRARAGGGEPVSHV